MSVSIIGVVTPGASFLRASHSRLICAATPAQSPRVEGIAHAAGGLDDAIEALEDVAVAVDVALHDFPVVRAREMRGAGVRQHDAALQIVRVDADARRA